MNVLAGYGMREGHAVGVEHQAAGARRSVQVVANQGMMLAGQVHTNLMLATGEHIHIEAPLPLGALNHHNGDRHLCGGFAAMAQPRSQNVSICNS